MDHLDPNVSLFAVARAENSTIPRSQAACERCAARIYPRASRHKSRPFRHSRVYVPKCVAKIYSQLPACSIEFKRIQRFNGFTILATVRDCKDAMDPKPQVFKDLQLCNARSYSRSKSLQRELERESLYSFRSLFLFLFYVLEYIEV